MFFDSISGEYQRGKTNPLIRFITTKIVIVHTSYASPVQHYALAHRPRLDNRTTSRFATGRRAPLAQSAVL